MNQHVPVRVDYRYAILHDKFVVLDGEVVETGSMNFTAAGEHSNGENVLVLHDPAVAQRYAQEWDQLWAESEEMGRGIKGRLLYREIAAGLLS